MSFRLSSAQDMYELRQWDKKFHARYASSGQVLAADKDGRLAGLMHVLRRDGLIELSWIVNPKYRRQGIGTRMVVNFARSADWHLYAAIPIENIPAQRIAFTAGFAPTEQSHGCEHFSRLPSSISPA